MPPTLDRAGIDRVIRRSLGQLRKPGVLTVRPGYEISGGRITGKPAIVVTVDRKGAKVRAANRLPEEVAGIPVDVRQATAMQALRQKDPVKHATARTYVRLEHAETEDPLERRVSDGKLLAKLPTAAHSAVVAATKKPQIAYTPAKLPLKAATRPMTIVACASPDAGFTVLSEFLKAAEKQLTVGMYDFTSAELLKTLTTTLRGGRTALTLVLDHPALNPTADQTDEQTIASIHEADSRAQTAWALSRPDVRATSWVFPYAYHIKVAVRDSAAFWLSSGNWNVSNQPDLAADKVDEGTLANADRDWHVVVMDEAMAKVFEAYIVHDFEVASGAQGPMSAAVQNSIDSALKQLKAEEAKRATEKAEVTSTVPFTLGRPRTFTKVPVTMQPLLTPDRGKRTSMYIDNVLALLNSAKKTLFVQMQYIVPTPGVPADKDFMLLVTALRQALKRGVDVRIICSEFENQTHSKDMELMHEQGLSGVLRIQQHVHNKGIVADASRVLVSSQNWSASGTTTNRDAGVIIHHAGIAAFFEAIFVEDWEHRARTAAAPGANASLPRAATGSTRGGRARPVGRATSKPAARTRAKPASGSRTKPTGQGSTTRRSSRA